MLQEFKNLRKEKNGFRRLFFSKKYDLYIWYKEKRGTIEGFQIVYNKESTQKAFTWSKEEGYLSNIVDEGDNYPINETPILVPDGKICKSEIKMIEKEMDNVEMEIKDFVLKKINEYP